MSAHASLYTQWRFFALSGVSVCVRRVRNEGEHCPPHHRTNPTTLLACLESTLFSTVCLIIVNKHPPCTPPPPSINPSIWDCIFAIRIVFFSFFLLPTFWYYLVWYLFLFFDCLAQCQVVTPEYMSVICRQIFALKILKIFSINMERYHLLTWRLVVVHHLHL